LKWSKHVRLFPGVRIVDLPAPLDDGLPVMDVPVFVGFAERGPLDRPVALEDPAHYTAVFGGSLDLVLAAEADESGSGQPPMMRAHLPAAVASFFAGGGRRCYVIRVADREQAACARFPLDGMRLATRPAGASTWRLADDDFALTAASPGSWADPYEVAVRLRSTPVHAEDCLASGDLLRGRSPRHAQITGWLRVARRPRPETLQQTLAGASPPDWLWTAASGEADGDFSPPPAPPASPPAPIDAADWQFERIRVDLALRHPQHGEIRREDCGLAAGASNLPWFEADAAGRHDAGEALPAADWPLAGATAPVDITDDEAPWLLLPVGVDAFFGPWTPAVSDGRDALSRNGLADYRPHLFTDPLWSDQLPDTNDAAILAAALQGMPRGSELRRWADDIRFFATTPRRLLGLHGALGRDDAVSRDATWIAVPDAVHPGWQREQATPVRSGQLLATPDAPCGHSSDSAFAGCRPPPPRIPQAPRLQLDALRATPESLAIAPADSEWTIVSIDSNADSSPPGAARVSFELQIARRPDFADARALTASDGEADDSPPWHPDDGCLAYVQPTVVAGPRHYAPSRYRLCLSAGCYFLRARSWRAGRYSDWSGTAEVLARAIGWRSRPATPEDGRSPLYAVHCALLDLCAATREHFALLALPADWTAGQLGSHANALRRHAASDFAAARSDSFVALYHPWLLRQDLAPAAQKGNGDLCAQPPEGAVLGILTRRSQQRGAWAAAGLDALPEVVALAGQTTDAEAIETVGVNPVERRPTGIAATGARTLSDDADWRSLGVRRLFILLRRLARREGERYAFEANDLTLRRSLEHRFDALLQRLLQRGAFRGDNAAEAYRLRTASGSTFDQEVDRGECSLEIRVAPSLPLRFLTLRVLRSGDQLSFEER
jgi:hypothetical protein